MNTAAYSFGISASFTMNIVVFATYCVLLLNMKNCHADVSQEARQVHDGQYSIVDTQLDRNKRPRRPMNDNLRTLLGSADTSGVRAQQPSHQPVVDPDCFVDVQECAQQRIGGKCGRMMSGPPYCLARGMIHFNHKDCRSYL